MRVSAVARGFSRAFRAWGHAMWTLQRSSESARIVVGPREPRKSLCKTRGHERDFSCNSEAAALGRRARCRRARRDRRADRHRRHADDRRRDHTRCARCARCPQGRWPARDRNHGPPDGLERAFRASVADRRDRRRERRGRVVPRRRHARDRVRAGRAHARTQRAAPARSRRARVARSARQRRSPGTAAAASPTSRSTTANSHICRSNRSMRPWP